MVGGLLEYMALVTGYRALLLLVFVLYALAFATRRASAAASPAEPFPASASSGPS